MGAKDQQATLEGRRVTSVASDGPPTISTPRSRPRPPGSVCSCSDHCGVAYPAPPSRGTPAPPGAALFPCAFGEKRLLSDGPGGTEKENSCPCSIIVFIRGVRKQFGDGVTAKVTQTQETGGTGVCTQTWVSSACSHWTRLRGTPTQTVSPQLGCCWTPSPLPGFPTASESAPWRQLGGPCVPGVGGLEFLQAASPGGCWLGAAALEERACVSGIWGQGSGGEPWKSLLRARRLSSQWHTPPTSTWDSTSCHFPKLDTCPGRQ